MVFGGRWDVASPAVSTKSGLAKAGILDVRALRSDRYKRSERYFCNLRFGLFSPGGAITFIEGGMKTRIEPHRGDM